MNISKLVLLLTLTFQIQPKHVKYVKLTYYWIAQESEFPLTEIKDLPSKLNFCSGGSIKVNSNFLEKAIMEGTGQLRDNSIVSCGEDTCNCFNRLTGSKAKGSMNNDLVTFKSIATNDFQFGTKIFVAKLKNLVLPDGSKHNGCLRVDDKSRSSKDNQIDLYVEKESNYKKLDSQFDGLDKVHIEINSQCKIDEQVDSYVDDKSNSVDSNYNSILPIPNGLKFSKKAINSVSKKFKKLVGGRILIKKL